MREVLQNWWFMLGNVMESVFLRFTTTLVSMQCVFFWIVEVAKFAKNMVLRKKYKSIGASFSTRVLITLSIKFLNRENPWEGGDASAILHFKTIEHNVRRLHPWCKSMWVARQTEFSEGKKRTERRILILKKREKCRLAIRVGYEWFLTCDTFPTVKSNHGLF